MRGKDLLQSLEAKFTSFMTAQRTLPLMRSCSCNFAFLN
uniref:Uncharacterized protein n=1 Tax=Arundo donax TaxID=35708 RepID=A0A0A9EH19_ARUDO